VLGGKEVEAIHEIMGENQMVGGRSLGGNIRKREKEGGRT